MAWKRCETRSTDHQYFIFHDMKFELFLTFPDAAARQMCQIENKISASAVLSECCSFSGLASRPKWQALPPRVNESCKFINVMTYYYHSQQPSAVARQDKVLMTSLARLETPTQANNSGYKATWFLKSFSQETYSRYFLNERLHKRISHETKSTFKFLADLEAHCAEAKTNKTRENSLVVPSCDVLCHCLPHT